MEKIYIGTRTGELHPGLESLPISKVEILNENGEIVGVAGDDTGRVLTAENPDGTNAMAADILASVTGYVYRPYEAEDALIDPAAELGDGVTIGGVYSVLANENITFDGLYSSGISAPGTDEIEDEYPYLSEYQRIKRSVAGTRSLITKTAEQIRLEVENELEGLSSSFTVELNSIRAEVSGVEDALSYIELDVDSITSRVQDAEGNISTLEQTATEFNLRLDSAEGVVSQMLYVDATSGFIFSNETGKQVTINGGQVELDTLIGSTIYFKDSAENIAADFAVTGASSTEQSKVVLSSGAIELAAIGGSIFLSSSLGPQLLLGRKTGSGDVYCQLSGGPLVIGADSYGKLADIPLTGTYGQVYFAIE